MKNLKYIFTLSSVFVSLFAFDYNANLEASKTSNSSIENNQKDIIINQNIKNNIFESFNENLSKNHTLNLNKGSLIYKNDNKPINLDFSGLFSISSNTLNSYVIDASYSYDSNKETFKVTSGNLDYSTITSDNKVYLFSHSNELSGILSFPASKDSKYPIINLNYQFSDIFNSFLNINESNFKVYTSLNGYSFINDNTSIKVDKDFNLIEVKSTYNKDLSFTLNFDELDSETLSGKVVKNSDNIVSTLKSLFDNNDFDVSYNASIKSSKSNNLRYSGFISSLNDSLSLNINEYINNNLQNEITSTFKDENIYFNISNGKEKGNLIDSEENDLVNATNGLMSTDSEFDVSFNTPLNALINTNIFKSILNLDLSNENINDLKEYENLKTFKVNSKVFGFTSDFDIRFEIELLNNSLKSISIKDFNTTSSNVMDVIFNINKSNSNTFKFNEEAYPVYNSLLPYYKKVVFIIDELKIGGNFNTSIVDNDSKTALGLSTHYDVNLGNQINNISLDTLNVSLTNLNINFKDITDQNKTSNLVNALFLQDTYSDSKSSFDMSIKSINYKNKQFYILLEDGETQNRYTLKNESLKNLISTVQKLTQATSGATTSSTDKGFSLIKKEINGITKLVQNIEKSDLFLKLKESVSKCNFSDLKNYLKIEIDEKYVSAEIILSELIKDDTIKDAIGYTKNASIKITLSKDDNSIVSISVSDISLADSSNKVSNTSVTLNEYVDENMITDTEIKNDWENTIEDPNKSKDLNDVLNRISDLVNVYSKYSLSNASLSNLISIDFAYNDLKLNGKLSSILHFNESKSLDEKYLETYLPFTFNSKTGSNDVSGASLSLVYSDKDSKDSSIKNLVYDENRLVKGTQTSISLYYGDINKKNNKNTTLNAYSSNDTFIKAIEAISKVDENTNILSSYNVIKTIKNLTSKIVNATNEKDMDVLQELVDSGILSIDMVMKLLNSLDSTSTSLDFNVDLSKFTTDASLSKLKINIKITLEKENDVISIKNLTASDENGKLSLKLNIDKSIINQDSTIGGTKIDSDIIEGFTPKGTENVNYVDMVNLANLIELGVTTTNKKYHSLSGTFSLEDTINFAIEPLNIDIDLSKKIQPVNGLTFNFQLQFYKDSDSKDATSKLKSYLSISNKNNSIQKVEFLTEQNEDGNDYVYINEVKGGINTTSYMNKDKLLGNVEVISTEPDDNGNTITTKTGKMPRILYYLLDFSGILLEDMNIDLSILKLDFQFKNVILSTLFDLMIEEKSEEETKSDISINYLSGWDIQINKDSTSGFINGYIEGDLVKIIEGIDKIDFGTLPENMKLSLGLNGKIKLSINQTSNDITKITLDQSNIENPLIHFNLEYGDIKLDLTVKLNTSEFTLKSTNVDNQIESYMKNYNEIITNFQSSNDFINKQEKYITKITCPEIYVRYTFPVTFKIYSNYKVNYNS